jgi:polyhydroxyalkanoate synthesis regulator phasin
MTETKDAILPVLKKIQDDISAVRKEQQAAKARDIDLTDAVLDTRDQVSGMRKDHLQHLGLTTRHRLDFDDLRERVDGLNARIAALESRS